MDIIWLSGIYSHNIIIHYDTLCHVYSNNILEYIPSTIWRAA